MLECLPANGFPKAGRLLKSVVSSYNFIIRVPINCPNSQYIIRSLKYSKLEL